MLNLPYLCSETYRERLMMLELIPKCYWHEYLDLVFFFKAINGLVHNSEDVLPQMVNPTRATRSLSLNSIMDENVRQSPISVHFSCALREPEMLYQ